MFKFAAGTAALLALSVQVSSVSFEEKGLRVGGQLVTENTLQLREAQGGTVLASATVVESLGGGVRVDVGGGREITVEPGIRLTRIGDGWRLSAHGGRLVSVSAAQGALELAGPVILKAKEGGWVLASGEKLEGLALRASVVTETAGVPSRIPLHIMPVPVFPRPIIPVIQRQNFQRARNLDFQFLGPYGTLV